MKKRVGRPKKKPEERRTDDLRIPMTPAEKRRVQLALSGEELAGWARGVIFEAVAKIENDKRR